MVYQSAVRSDCGFDVGDVRGYNLIAQYISVTIHIKYIVVPLSWVKTTQKEVRRGQCTLEVYMSPIGVLALRGNHDLMRVVVAT